MAYMNSTEILKLQLLSTEKIDYLVSTEPGKHTNQLSGKLQKGEVYR